MIMTPNPIFPPPPPQFQPGLPLTLAQKEFLRAWIKLIGYEPGELVDIHDWFFQLGLEEQVEKWFAGGGVCGSDRAGARLYGKDITMVSLKVALFVVGEGDDQLRRTASRCWEFRSVMVWFLSRGLRVVE
jgi:hypothetical protein